MTLVEAGTRVLIDARSDRPSRAKLDNASRLLHLLTPGMLVLWDKGFDRNDFLSQAVATRAQALGRLRSKRRTPVLARLADGSHLSVIGTVGVRIGVRADRGDLRGQHDFHRLLPARGNPH